MKTLVTAAILFAAPAMAQDHAHGSHEAAQSPSTTAYMQAAEAMHTDMAFDYTGDADVDFVRGMIPHHEGAVAMARIVLEHGQDPEIRDLARGVVDAQEAELKVMQDWLAKNGH